MVTDLGGTITPWADGDIPFNESLDVEAYQTTADGIRKCHSFRADLLHKLRLIIEAHGGYGTSGLSRAAQRLRIDRSTLRRWAQYIATPRTKCAFERIDSAYEEAIDKLAKALLKKKK